MSSTDPTEVGRLKTQGFRVRDQDSCSRAAADVV